MQKFENTLKMAGTFRKWTFKDVIWQAQNQFVEACQEAMSFDVSVYQIPIAVRIFIKYSVNQLILISIVFNHINQFPSSHVKLCPF